MSKETWTAVDDYAAELLVPQDEALQSALESSRAAGLPQIQVSRAQGKWLHLLARAMGLSKRECFRWSIALFAARFPRSFASCQQRGLFLVR